MLNLNSKKLIKIVSTIIMVLMILSIFGNIFNVFADVNPGDFTPDTEATGATKSKTLINQILGIVQVIGVGVAVIMLIALAIKYISAAPTDKAEIKKSATMYIVGAVLLFGATGLLQIIKGFGDTINGK